MFVRIQNYMQLHLPLLTLLATIGFVELLFGDQIELLLLGRQAVFDGEYYRIFTGHFTHLNLAHTLLNLIVVAICWTIFFSAYSRRIWIGAIFVFSIMISLGLLTLTTIDWYGGFSGVAHGMIVIGILGSKQFNGPIKLVLIIGILLKVGYEMFFGTTASITLLIGGDVAEEAHLLGVVSGILFWMTLRVSSRMKVY